MKSVVLSRPASQPVRKEIWVRLRVWVRASVFLNFWICIFLNMCIFVFVYSCICFQFAKSGQKGEQLSWVRASAGEFARSADTERPAVALRLSRRTHLLTMYIAPNLWEHVSGTNLWEKHLCAVKWHSLRHIFSMKEGFSQCDSNLCPSTLCTLSTADK